MYIKPFLDYLSLEKKYSPHTIKAYQSDLQYFKAFALLEYTFEEEDLVKINYSCIRHWIRDLSDKGNTNKTINRKLTTLSSFYTFMKRVKAVASNPMTNHIPLKTRKTLQTPFSEKEIRTLLDNKEFFSKDFLGIRNKLIFEMFYATGLRRSELLSIEIGDLSLEQKTMRVLGKGSKERILPLTKRVVLMIERYLTQRQKVNVLENQNLFLTQKGFPLSETILYKVVRNHLKLVSSKEKKSPHMLRHSFATHLLNNGADLNSIKELMGHSTIASTQHYATASLKHLKSIYKSAHPRSIQDNKEEL